MNTLQIIFSHTKGQDVANIPLDLINLKKKEYAISYLKTLLYGKYSFLEKDWREIALEKASLDGKFSIPEVLQDVPELVKISMCIICNNGIKFRSPKWYNECNGKIYFEFTRI